MIAPPTLYTIRNIETQEVLFQTIKYQDVLDLIIKPFYIEKGSIVVIPNNTTIYKIENVIICPYEKAQLHIDELYYNFHTLIEVSS